MSVEILSEPHWLEKLSWGCQLALTLLAFAAAVFAYIQIQQIKSDSAQQLKMAHASILLEIDHRWDNDMREARQILNALTDDIEALVSSQKPSLKGAARQKAVKAEWLKTLDAMRKQPNSSYSKVLAICGFFETVGLMVKNNYVSADDVLGLLKAAILGVDYYLRGHIEARAKEKGMPKGLFEHALHLCDLAKKS